ncbi:Ca2+:H+ antiporter, partial [Tremellales sp. Uapishka_1]
MANTPPSDHTDPALDPGSSPTPTIRNGTIATPTATSTEQAVESSSGITPTANQGMSGHVDHQTQQQDLGKGRPKGGDSLEQHRPPPVLANLPLPDPSAPSSPVTRLTPGRAASLRSYSTDDEYYYDATSVPRTAAVTPGMGETTPRMGGTRRGAPLTGFGSFGSPTAQHHAQMSSGGSSARPPRTARYNTSHVYPSQGNSMSRSASRVRPPLPTVNSAGPMTVKKDDEDDAVVPRDRGEDLIRRRMKERKKARRDKEKERERRLAEGLPVNAEGMTPGVGGLTDDAIGLGRGSSLGPTGGRSVSRSANTDRRQPSAGYFPSYAASIASEMPSPGNEFRPASIYSSAADEEDDEATERVERAPSIMESVVQDVVHGEVGSGDEEEQDAEEEEGNEQEDGDEGVTLRDRQDAINIEHPFGLPIWKPALYKKSRSVTRNADSALHNIPSAAAERHLLPGNILWVLIFGWWLAVVCLGAALLVGAAEVCGGGRGGYGKTLRGLAWYVGWPFGKYVEGEGPPEEGSEDDHSDPNGGLDVEAAGEYGSWESGDGSPVRFKRPKSREPSDSSGITVRDAQRSRPTVSPTSPPTASASTIKVSDQGHERRETCVSFAPTTKGKSRDSSLHGLDEETPLLSKKGAFRRPRNQRAKILGRIVYWPVFTLVVAPVMLLVCVLCWGMVITIPMARLTWALLNLLYFRPLEINFRSAPKVPVPTPSPPEDSSADTTINGDGSPGYTMKRAHLTAGQIAPTSGPTSTVLLCTYRAVGLQYYKYTVGGVNIMFVNLLPLVFFTIFDAFVLLPIVERNEHHGRDTDPLLKFIASQALIFVLSLASVIPLSYFIGMAVASISAQSSIGMGAVINATFGSIIEIILYGIALTQGKGRLVEGSIVGSILAGVLLMPGASMCSGALKRKEQRFNAKSAGVTSTMLIMAIIGTLTPTMFYQTYGSFQLHCEGCPDTTDASAFRTAAEGWMCDHCYYEHPDPMNDPFYQNSVKTLMYCCAGILLLSYLIGLWFSLRTHASQIWQNPQQLMKSDEAPPTGPMHPALRNTLTQRITPQNVLQHVLPVHKTSTSPPVTTSRLGHIKPYTETESLLAPPHAHAQSRESSRAPSRNYNLPSGYTPFLEAVNQSNVTPIRLPSSLTTEDFTRAVAVATVSALRHQGSIIGSAGGSAQKPKSGMTGGAITGEQEDEDEAGGHEGPSWTRGVSAGVLLGCTLLYALIAEILVDVVDVVLQGSGIDEKFLGVTLFALVPNTTEFMNAMSFALNGNIALSMEIGSAYALQVCLLQIPAMVAFSALFRPERMGDVIDTFTLIFPRWDVIAIILSIFLLTYTYIEARSNYHRGSILVLAYIVLTMGFYFAPPKVGDGPDGDALTATALLGLKI